MENFIDNKKVHEMVMVALEERWEAIRSHIHRVSDSVRHGHRGRHRRAASSASRTSSGRPNASARRWRRCAIPMMLVQCMDDPEKATPSEMADFIVKALK